MAQPLNYSLDFDSKLPPAEQARIRDGMKRADDNANFFWKRIIDGAVLAAARRLPEITVDDVLDEMEAINVTRKLAGKELIETHNLSAIGPAMKRAARDKILSPTNMTKRSRKEGKHGNRHSVWKSNYFAQEVNP